MNFAKSSSYNLSTVILLILITVTLMAIPKSWKGAIKENADGSISFSADWAGQITRKKDSYAYQELYMLTAARDGYFLCGHCPNGKFYLKAGEVYRYGTTGSGKDKRGYNDNWLAKSALNFVLLQTGDLTTIKTEEAALIGGYVLHPENMLRPLQGESAAEPSWYRLVLPPGNNSLD